MKSGFILKLEENGKTIIAPYIKNIELSKFKKGPIRNLGRSGNFSLLDHKLDPFSELLQVV